MGQAIELISQIVSLEAIKDLSFSMNSAKLMRIHSAIEVIKVTHLSTGQLIGTVPAPHESDLTKAVDVAKEAFKNCYTLFP